MNSIYVLLVTLLVSQVSAQVNAGYTTSMLGGVHEIFLLPETNEVLSIPFPIVLGQTTIMVCVEAQNAHDISIKDPSGDTLSQGVLELITTQNESLSDIYPTALGTYQWCDTVEVALPGIYVIEIHRSNVVGDVAMLVTAVADRSPLGASLVAVTDELMGNAVGISMFVFEDGNPCAGQVDLVIIEPDGVFHSIALHDNGGNGDPEANDGAYSGVFLATKSGRHIARAIYQGITPSGLPVQHLSASTAFDPYTHVQVLPDPPIALDPLPWSVRYEYIDVNNNGKYEQIYLIYDATMINSTRGVDYEMTASVSAVIDDTIHLPFSMVMQKSCIRTTNEFRYLIPMQTISAYIGNGRLRTGQCTIRSVADSTSGVLHGGGEYSEYINFEQLEHCPADVNQDWLVTPADFSAWIAAYNASDIAADANGDGQVTPADFSAWISHYDSGC